MIIKNAECKSLNSFGAFLTVNGELDVLCHIHEASYSRINHVDEVFEVGKLYDVMVINVDIDKLQIGVSRKKMFPDPFDDIDNYQINSKHEVTIDKITEFGAFCSLKPGLISLLHNTELSHTNKNASAKKMFKVGQKIFCIITNIDKENRKIAISYKKTFDSPYDVFESKYPIGTIDEAEVISKNEYALFVKFKDTEAQMFLHANNLSYLNNGEEELNKYKKNDKILVKVLEVNSSEQKIRCGHRETKADPYDWFKDKKINQVLTVKIVSKDNKGLTVRPEGGCEINLFIKKSQIAINPADCRISRFVDGDRIDCCIADISLEKRKVSLSIKLLEELQNKEAVTKFSSPLSGKNLPFKSLSEKFSSLTEKLGDKKNKNKKE